MPVDVRMYTLPSYLLNCVALKVFGSDVVTNVTDGEVGMAAEVNVEKTTNKNAIKNFIISPNKMVELIHPLISITPLVQ